MVPVIGLATVLATRSDVAQNADHAGGPGAAQILRKAERMTLELHIASLAADLGEHVADLRDTGRTDRMSFGFQAAAGINGFLALAGSGAGGFIGTSAAALDEAEILERDNLGDSKTIVHFGELNIARADAGHFVSFFGRPANGMECGDIRFLVQGHEVRSLRHAENANGFICKISRTIGGNQQDGRGAVADERAIVEAQGLGYGPGIESLVE